MTCNWITTDYKLASGHNNAANLVAITSITDGTNALAEPLVIPNYTRGVRRNRCNGTVNYAGLQSITMTFSYMTYGQYVYLKANYEGLVTARLALASTTFANYNASLVLPEMSELEWTNLMQPASGGWLGVSLELRHITAI